MEVRAISPELRSCERPSQVRLKWTSRLPVVHSCCPEAHTRAPARLPIGPHPLRTRSEHETAWPCGAPARAAVSASGRAGRAARLYDSVAVAADGEHMPDVAQDADELPGLHAHCRARGRHDAEPPCAEAVVRVRAHATGFEALLERPRSCPSAYTDLGTECPALGNPDLGQAPGHSEGWAVCGHVHVRDRIYSSRHGRQTAMHSRWLGLPGRKENMRMSSCQRRWVLKSLLATWAWESYGIASWPASERDSTSECMGHGAQRILTY